MRSTTRAFALALLVVASLVVTSSAQTSMIDKAYMGVWKMNIAKSTFSPGPGPKEAPIRTHEDRGNGFVLVMTDGVNNQGQKTHGAYVYKPDGKDYPVAGTGQTAVMTIALKAIDAYTVEFSQKADGRVVGTGTRTVSKDGKTMTISTKGTNPQGQPTSSTTVWEKQPGRSTSE